ncbi:hypothetical protein [Chitinophaga sancti]|uniref:hypothetical protein n=1 Tax=Chitinophaga sancti TaxID=1004 RepID=UPI003F7A5793
MKTTISLIVCGVAFVLYCCSCQKNTDSNPPSTNPSSQKVMVSLRPGGEFSVDQSAGEMDPSAGKIASTPKMLNGGMIAKTLRDSTYYSVEIWNGTTKYALGIFDNPDSIHFLLDPAYTYRVRLIVLQKGTGHGFYHDFYEWGDTYGNPQDNGKPLFYYPIGGILQNHMDYAPNIPNFAYGFGENGTDYQTFTSDSTGQIITLPLGEATTYGGEVKAYTVDPSHPSITIPMRRLVFGIKYTCPQLTQGRLVVTFGYPNYLPGKVLYPNTIDHALGIYSAVEFLGADTLARGSGTIGTYDIIAGIKWELPDGRTYDIGSSATTLPTPGRNQLLNVHITLPVLDSSATSGNSSLSLKYSTTSWSTNTPIRF